MYAPAVVSSEEIDRYRGLIERLAFRLAKLDVPLAEFDDLVQVGMISVLRALRRGSPPSKLVIEGAMKNELRRCSRLGWDVDPLPDELDMEFLALDGVE